MFRDEFDAFADFYDLRPNATCTDCGVDFHRNDNDPHPSTVCQTCSDRRDAHTTMLERRLRMAKASLHPSAVLAAAPKLTSGELALAVALIGNGFSLQQAIDKIQAQRGTLPFTPNAPEAA